MTIQALYHAGRAAESQVGLGILRSGVDEMNFALSGVDRLVTLESEAVAARDLGYIDFLMPGIIGMAIMQLGLFSVSFSFVTMKREGVLRRLLATPLSPSHPAGFAGNHPVTGSDGTDPHPDRRCGVPVRG